MYELEGPHRYRRLPQQTTHLVRLQIHLRKHLQLLGSFVREMGLMAQFKEFKQRQSRASYVSAAATESFC